MKLRNININYCSTEPLQLIAYLKGILPYIIRNLFGTSMSCTCDSIRIPKCVYTSSISSLLHLVLT